VTTSEQPLSGLPGLKARAKRLAAPVVAKAREEVVRVTADDQLVLRAELAELRAELARQRAEHQAELAAIHEELAGLVAAKRR
jgi:hypothetical protein